MVRGLERGPRVDADEAAGRHVHALWRLAEVERERAGEDDERLLLLRMAVTASLRAGLVAPDVAAHMREAGAVAQLGDMPRRLVGLVRTRDPLESVGMHDVVAHLPESKEPSRAPSAASSSPN